MLGLLVFVFSLIALFVGLELGSPGVLKAVIHACISMTDVLTGHTGQQICDQLQRLGDQAAVCAKPA